MRERGLRGGCSPLDLTLDPSVSTRRLLKEFEREARTDGMPANVLAERKKALADQLNGFINRKKDIGNQANKDELFAGATKDEEQPMEREYAQTSKGSQQH